MGSYNSNWRSSSKNQQQILNLGMIRSFSEHPYGRFTGLDSPNQTNQSYGRSPNSSRSSVIQKFWKKLRRKFRKEKKAFGSGKHSNPVIVPYNSYTYSMNFDDQVVTSAEPENLSRSFSARFATSSSSSRLFLNRVQSVR